MDDKLSLLFEEAINLELNVSTLYSLFNTLFPDDADFWWNLVLEENNHASLIRSIREHFKPHGVFPEKLLAFSLPKMAETNKQMVALIEKCKQHPPSRKEALKIALDIENSAYEIHYQEFMVQESASPIDKVFHDLNNEDKNHAKRIQDYMSDHCKP